MLRRVILILVVAAAGLVGCAANQYGSLRDDYTFDSAPGEGLVVFSTRWEFTCESPALAPIHPVNPTLAFEGADSFASILYNPLIARHFDEPPGYLFSFSRKAGTYSAKNLEFYIGDRYFSEPVQPHETLFEIREGHITYLGELTVRVVDCIYPNRVQAKGTVEFKVADQWARDRKLLAERLPRVDLSKAKISPLGMQKH